MLGIYDVTLASAYANAGQYAESEHEYQRALALAEKAQGRQSLDYALLVASLAVLPTQIGNRDLVVELLRGAIAFDRRTSSPRELAIVRGCLAHILMDQLKYTEAESVLLDSQADFASLKMTDPRQLSDLLSDLGVLKFDQGRYGDSIKLLRESLRLLQDAIGDEHAALVVPLSNLALSYLKLGRLNAAELTLKRAMGICSRSVRGGSRYLRSPS